MHRGEVVCRRLGGWVELAATKGEKDSKGQELISVTKSTEFCDGEIYAWKSCPVRSSNLK